MDTEVGQARPEPDGRFLGLTPGEGDLCRCCASAEFRGPAGPLPLGSADRILGESYSCPGMLLVFFRSRSEDRARGGRSPRRCCDDDCLCPEESDACVPSNVAGFNLLNSIAAVEEPQKFFAPLSCWE